MKIDPGDPAAAFNLGNLLRGGGRKVEAEAALKKSVAADPKLKAAANSWEQVEASLRKLDSIYTRYSLYESGTAFNSELFSKARTLLRLVEETSKPNADRLREYRQSNLESLEQELFSEAPIYEDLEIVKLADSLGMLIEQAGAEDPLVPVDQAALLAAFLGEAGAAVTYEVVQGGHGLTGDDLSLAGSWLAKRG